MMKQILAARSGELHAASHPRRRPHLGRDELLRRCLDRAAARLGLRADRRAAVHAGDRLRRRPVDVLQVPARRPVRAVSAWTSRSWPSGGRSIDAHRGAGRAGPAGAGRAGFLLPARHRRHRLPARARQVDGRRRSRSTCAAAALGYFHNQGYYHLEGRRLRQRLPPRRSRRPERAAAVRRVRQTPLGLDA